MSGKAKTILCIYAAAVFAVLSVWSAVSYTTIESYRLQEQVASGRAFEQTVSSVDALGDALQKSLYATDGAMCAGICSEIYADALSAEASLAALPFSTQELENISGYLNTAGDYAYTLCHEASQDGFTPEQVETLTSLSDKARQLSEQLEALRTGMNDRGISMDYRVTRLSNIGADIDRLSSSLLTLDTDMGSMEAPQYDGKYTLSPDTPHSTKSAEDTRKTAAEFLGVDPAELRPEYEYSDGRRCWSAGSVSVTVGDNGVETMEDSRLVSESSVSPADAEKAAAEFLSSHGFDKAQPENSGYYGSSIRFGFTCGDTDAVCGDGCIKVTVALDDGSITGFDCRECYLHRSSEFTAEWAVSPEEAAEALPESLTLNGTRKTVIKTAGGSYAGCYELSCTDPSGQEVKIYVNASTGRQQEIKIV